MCVIPFSLEPDAKKKEEQEAREVSMNGNQSLGLHELGTKKHVKTHEC